MGPILSKLKRHRDLLSDEKITAAIFEVQDMRESIERQLETLSRKFQELHLDIDESKVLQQRVRRDKQREFVFHKLGAPGYQYDFDRAARERSKNESGDWILNEDIYKEWTDTGIVGTKVLYLNGIPGAGECFCGLKSWRSLY